jgi:hypothetical protein
MQAIEDLQFCDVVPLADRVEDLNEFLEVQEAVAVGVHQTKSSFDLNQKKCLVIVVVIVLIIIMFPQNNEPILIFKKIHFQDTFFDSAVHVKFVNRIFFRFFFLLNRKKCKPVLKLFNVATKNFILYVKQIKIKLLSLLN